MSELHSISNALHGSTGTDAYTVIHDGVQTTYCKGDVSSRPLAGVQWTSGPEVSSATSAHRAARSATGMRSGGSGGTF